MDRIFSNAPIMGTLALLRERITQVLDGKYRDTLSISLHLGLFILITPRTQFAGILLAR